jgi:hypothetical protein
VGFREFGEGGSAGCRVGQTGSVYKQPEREVDDSYHNWRVPSKWKGIQRGTQRGARGQQQGAGKANGKRHVYVIVLYVQWND